MGFNSSPGTAANTTTTPSGVGNFGNILSLGGMATSGIGAYYSSQAQKSALAYQATVAETNARLAEKSAQSVLLQGQQQQNHIQLRTAQMSGAQKSGFAANGVDLGEGSAARILTDTETMGKLDADMAGANAVRSAWGYRMQGVNSSNDALMKQASSDAVSPLSAGFSTLLTSAGTVAKNWYAQKKAGVN